MVGGLFLVLVVVIIIRIVQCYVIKKRGNFTSERGAQKEQMEESNEMSPQSIYEQINVNDKRSDESSSQEITIEDNVVYDQATPLIPIETNDNIAYVPATAQYISTEANSAYGGITANFTAEYQSM